VTSRTTGPGTVISKNTPQEKTEPIVHGQHEGNRRHREAGILQDFFRTVARTSFQAFLPKNLEAGPRNAAFLLETFAKRNSNPRRAGGVREARSCEPRTRESSCLWSHGCAEAQRDLRDLHANAPR
jgi:hypothetical protein